MTLHALLAAVWLAFAPPSPGPSAEGPAPEPCVSFTLANRGLRAIPLRIPGVMNPNLSPMSNSGVCLEPGQRIYLQREGKDRLLLEVTADLADSVLVVNRLLREGEEGR
jgi:hypothetical protein